MSSLSSVPRLRPRALPNPLVPARRFTVGGVAAFVAIVAILIAGAVLRWGALGRESFWFDEGYTAWAASLSPAQMLKVIRADVSPPGYYFLLHYWAMLFGQSETALRAMSAFFATLSMGVFWLLARRVLKAPVAVVVAMALFAMSVMQIEYSKDARFYTLVTFLSLVSLYALQRFLDLRARGIFGAGCMAAIVLSAALNIYSHNLMILYVGMLDLLWLVLPAGEAAERVPLKRRLLDLLLANAAIGLLYLPWVPGLLGQLSRVHGDFWAGRPDVGALFDEFALLTGVKNHYPTWMFYHVPWLNRCTSEAVVFVTLAIPGLFIVWECLRPRGKRTAALLALVAYAGAPVVFVWLLSRYGARSMFIDRVFIASCPISALVLAAPFARPARSRRQIAGRIAAALLVLFLGFWMTLSVAGWWEQEHREDWRAVYEYVSQLPRDGRLILFVANEGEIVFDYYAQQRGQVLRKEETLGLPEGFFELDPPRTSRRVLKDSDLDRLKAAVNSGRYTRIVYVKAHDWYSDPDSRVGVYLYQHCALTKVQMFTEGVYVFEFAPGNPVTR